MGVCFLINNYIYLMIKRYKHEKDICIRYLAMSYSYHNFDRVSSYSKRLLFGRRERFVRLFERVDSGITQTYRHALHAQQKNM